MRRVSQLEMRTFRKEDVSDNFQISCAFTRAQLYLTLWDPMELYPPAKLLFPWDFQARILKLEPVAISNSRESS